jgi:hypothetical protein
VTGCRLVGMALAASETECRSAEWASATLAMGCRLVGLALVASGTVCRSAEWASVALATGCRLVGLASAASGTGCRSAVMGCRSAGWVWEWVWVWVLGLAWEWDCTMAESALALKGRGALVSAWACRRRSSVAGRTATASPWAACARPWEVWWGSGRRSRWCRPGSPRPGSRPPGPAPAPLCHPLFSPTLLTHCTL